MTRRRAALACAALIATAAAAAAAGTRSVIVEGTTLRDGPAGSAAPVARLEPGTAVERGARSGGWLAVETTGARRHGGWVRVWHVRTVPADADGGNPLLDGLARFSRAVSGLFGADDAGAAVDRGEVTATLGVRGLEPGEFTAAQPDPAARRRLASLRADEDDAGRFARQAGLQRRDIGAVGAGAGEARDWGEW